MMFRMKFLAGMLLVSCLASLLPVGVAPVAAAEIDLAFAPASQTVPLNSVGHEFGIQLVMTTDGAMAQAMVVVDAIVDYDPGFLEFLGVDDTANCCLWFFSGFLPDPDGINLDLSDGRFVYSALAQPGIPEAAAVAPGSIVTTLRFRALAVTSATVVSLVPAQGSFAETRVLLLPGEDQTGDISGTAVITILDPGFFRAEVNGDGVINIADPIFTLSYLFISGPTPSCLDSADSNDDGSINIADPVYTLAYLFSSGPLPPTPFPACGVDPTFDALDCDSFPFCP